MVARSRANLILTQTLALPPTPLALKHHPHPHPHPSPRPTHEPSGGVRAWQMVASPLALNRLPARFSFVNEAVELASEEASAGAMSSEMRLSRKSSPASN